MANLTAIQARQTGRVVPVVKTSTAAPVNTSAGRSADDAVIARAPATVSIRANPVATKPSAALTGQISSRSNLLRYGAGGLDPRETAYINKSKVPQAAKTGGTLATQAGAKAIIAKLAAPVVTVTKPATTGTKPTTTIIPTKATTGGSGVTPKTSYPSSPISSPDQGGGAGGLSPATNVAGNSSLGTWLKIGGLAVLAILAVYYLRKHKRKGKR